MPYLFQVSLGPVQSFIQGARRTRDLKFSSSFLSTLARVAAATIGEQCGETSLIFPVTLTAGDVPNKILAYIEKEISPEDLATFIQKQVKTKVEKISDQVFSTLPRELFQKTDAEQQVANLVEYLWASVEHDERNGDYAISRMRLEALLAARKNTRNFAPVTWGSEQRKSSIDGQLECVIAREAYPRIPNRRTMGQVERQRAEHQVRELRKHFGAGPHEKLSGVDLLKRLGAIEEGEKTFPSTSHMAALSFLSGLRNLRDEKRRAFAEKQLGEYRRRLIKIKETLPSFQPDILPKAYQQSTFGDAIVTLDEYDGALLYPERFPDVVGDAQLFQAASQQFQKAASFLETFLQEIGLRPDPYYALLVADGDGMSKVIDALAKQEQGMARHRELSRTLVTFETEVRQIIENHAGVRIYSGGDDVLALLPLHSAVTCAFDLAITFRKALAEVSSASGKTSSLSAGLAIVHHLHPLGDALAIARRAEAHAKRGKKNALTIIVQKRGGPPCEVGGQWSAFIARLERQITLCRNESIPSGMAYELEELALRLENEQESGPELSQPHVRYAALRVFQRKLGEEGGRAKNRREEMALALYALKKMVGLIGTDKYSEQSEQAFNALKEELKVKNEETERLAGLRKQVNALDQLQPVRVGVLADELIVARLFAHARDLAGVENEGGKE